MKYTTIALLTFALLVAGEENDNSAGLRGGTKEQVGARILRATDGSPETDDTPQEHPAPKTQHPAPKTQDSTLKRVIVTYRQGCKADAMSTMKAANDHRSHGEPEIEMNYEFDDMNTMVVTGTPREIEMIENCAQVESVQPDLLRAPMAIEGSNADLSGFFAKGSRSLMQERPYGVDLVQAPALWAKNATGQGVKVCVIDSGIDADHPDFVNANLDGSGQWFQDGCGHGTHVSGTIAGEDDTAGVIGVAPDAEIFTVRVFGDSCGFAFSSGIFSAAQICQDNGASIISMSLGGPGASAFEQQAFTNMFNEGILLVAAAGNDGNTAFSFPASYDSVMSVGALNSNKQIASFSQRNSQVDIAAPGVRVLSTFPNGGCAICGNNIGGFGVIDGTSMATPHVSAVAALLKSAVPSATSADLRNAIEASAEDLGVQGRDDSFGFGLVQADAALQLLTGSTGGGGSCSDTPGWFDAEGLTFDCAWYGQKSNCQHYGNAFENQGKTASQACCVCGGGTGTATATDGAEFVNSGCSDSPDGWYDSEGPNFDCAWYAAEADRCEKYGDGFENNGKTAKEACCACRGGSS